MIKQERVANLCSSWLLRQRSSSLMPAPGTTFPPLRQNLPYFKEKLERFASSQQDGLKNEKTYNLSCLSEPDLSIGQEDEDDLLFEFDIGSPANENGDDMGSEFDQINVVNVMEDYEEMVGTDSRFSRSFSISSDTCSNCSSSKDTFREDTLDGYSTLSSGIGSERISSQENTEEEDPDDMDGRLEGLSVGPEFWKQNCAMYLMNKGEGSGSATPIISPKVTGSISPLVSPDSLLGDEIEKTVNLCNDCHLEALEQSSSSSTIENDNIRKNISFDSLPDMANEILNSTELSQEDPNEINENIERVVTAVELSEIKSDQKPEDQETTQDNSCSVKNGDVIAINKDLIVSTDKLAKLMVNFEEDKHFKSGQLKKTDFLTPPKEGESDSEEEVRPKLRKCSSLRTGRTPPVTPGNKKIVRFADIFGLDLSEVKIFADEIPKIPKKAYADLDVDPSEYSNQSPTLSKPEFMSSKYMNGPIVNNKPSTTLIPMFNQPGTTTNFYEQIHSQKVVLESAFMDGSDVVSGVIRVLNISFHKSVKVRWTTNNWSTVEQKGAEYIPGSSNGGMDKFSFKLVAQEKLAVGGRLQFCINYSTNGQEFWDSNYGANYAFQVFPSNNFSSGRANVKNRSNPVDMYSRTAPSPYQGKSFFSGHSPSQHGDDPWLRFM